jgi:hypothetical protein
MVTGVDVLSAFASALQIVGMIYSIGNRILDKPKDTESVRLLAVQARGYITQLKQCENTFTGDAKEACKELDTQLLGLIGEIDRLSRKKGFDKVKTLLKLWKPEFREKFSDALEKFKFCICIESQRSKGEMDDKLRDMTEKMKELHIVCKTLETLPGMEGGVAQVEEMLHQLLREISTLTSSIEKVQSVLTQLESESEGKARLEEVVCAEGEITREALRQTATSVVEAVERVHERQMLNDSLIELGTEILPRSSNLVWYDECKPNRSFKVWSLDETPKESTPDIPQANWGGIELRSIRLKNTYNELHEKRYIADDVVEDVREKKRQRLSDVSPYVSLGRRGDDIEEMREFVPSSFEEQLRNALPREVLPEALRVVRSLSQEYRYLLLDQIFQQKAYTLPKLHILEELERAMLAINAGKLEARLGFFTQYTVDQVDFPYQLLLDITRYVLVILESDCAYLFVFSDGIRVSVFAHL